MDEDTMIPDADASSEEVTASEPAMDDTTEEIEEPQEETTEEEGELME